MYKMQHLHLNTSLLKRKKVFTNCLLGASFSTNLLFTELSEQWGGDVVFLYLCYKHRNGGLEELNHFPKGTELGGKRSRGLNLLLNPKPMRISHYFT